MNELSRQVRQNYLRMMRRSNRKSIYRVYYLKQKFTSYTNTFITVAANDKREALFQAKEFARTCLFAIKKDFDRVVWGRVEKVLSDEKYKGG